MWNKCTFVWNGGGFVLAAPWGYVEVRGTPEGRILSLGVCAEGGWILDNPSVPNPRGGQQMFVYLAKYPDNSPKKLLFSGKTPDNSPKKLVF